MRAWEGAALGLLACTGCGELHGVAPVAEDGSANDAGGDAVSASSQCTAADKRVFVSTATYPTGGPGPADVACGAEALSIPNSNWVAWLAFGATTAPSRLAKGVGFCTVGKVRVVADTADLARGTLLHGIDVDSDGTPVMAGARVWTGANVKGESIGDDCLAWTSDNAADRGRFGLVGATDATWTDEDAMPCNGSAHLYCFEQ